MKRLSRRKFMEMAAAAGWAWPSLAASAARLGRPAPGKGTGLSGLPIGLQLYSVRDEMNKDAAGTLRRVMEIGYTAVEHAGYWKGKFYGYPAAEFRQLLAGIGLDMLSGHVSIEAEDYDGKGFSDNWKLAAESAAAAGQQYLITPGFPEAWRKDTGTLLRYLDVFNACGTFCKTYGVKFGYHNHTMEFERRYDGSSLYELMLQHTDPSLVALQLDVGLTYAAGVPAQELMRQHPGRFELMHVKDEMAKPGGGERGQGYESTVLGKGEVRIGEMVNIGREKGVKHFIVEQESFQQVPELECAKENFGFMNNLTK